MSRALRTYLKQCHRLTERMLNDEVLPNDASAHRELAAILALLLRPTEVSPPDAIQEATLLIEGFPPTDRERIIGLAAAIDARLREVARI